MTLGHDTIFHTSHFTAAHSHTDKHLISGEPVILLLALLRREEKEEEVVVQEWEQTCRDCPAFSA